MKTTYKIITLTTACLLALSSYAQQRHIDWIHGLGGDDTSWDNTDPTKNRTATNYFAARQVISYSNKSFPTGNGVNAMAINVGQNTPYGSDRIAIAHSMGGMVTRRLDILNDGRWVGIITLGSPLRGARIVDAVKNGETQAFINNAVVQLLKGPKVGTIALAGNPGAGIVIGGTGLFGSIYSNQIASSAVDNIVQKLSLTPTTTDDLSPDGAYTATMATQNTPTPKINIWGSESDPLLWRLAGTFTVGDDEAGVSTLNTIAATYNNYANTEFAASWLAGSWGLAGLQTFYQWRGNEWKAGYDWMMYTSNDAWANIIGAAYSQTVSGSTPKMICDYNYYYSTCGSSPNPDACRAACWVSQPYSYTNYYKTESDGIVPATSQRNDGGAWKGNVVRADGNINHQEHLRWDRIKPTLDKAFNGNYASAFTIIDR